MLNHMSRVGLVLGGGGITGAAFEFASLMALRLATNWDPATAELIVGTSSGATVAAAARGGGLDIATMTLGAHHRDEFAQRLGTVLLSRTSPRGWGRWVRHGLLPGLRRPGIDLALGGPAIFDPTGISNYVEAMAGPLADSWPDQPTWVVACQLDTRQRVVFGVPGAPLARLRDAVAGSAAVPMLYQPVEIDGVLYVDGGVISGTNADLVLEFPEPLDLVIVVAPLAGRQPRSSARLYQGIFERIGFDSLDRELHTLKRQAPDTDILVLRPDQMVLTAARSNPMSPTAAVPTFVRTLAFLRRELAKAEVWEMLSHHLIDRQPTRR